MSQIIVTTGYKDIGRVGWDAFGRPNDYYFDGFRKLVAACPYPLVAYMERAEREALAMEDTNLLRIIPMEGLDILAYTHMEKDWEVLNSPEYKILMKGCIHRGNHPERSKKGYNMVTSSKSNLVKITKEKFPGYRFYAWQDFGHANIMGGTPQLIDLDKVAEDKITIKGMLYDPTKGPRIDPVGFARIGGAPYVCSAQIIVPNAMVEIFDQMMRSQIDFNHSIGLTDDDQSILALVANSYPQMFDCVMIANDWFGLWKEIAKR